ncbi:hypothetical protein [Sphingomonas sp.]|uniref:hypothetical protein n=1 Tax=Sphingomonas sp. TaxID=28214 RepID=UPI003B00A3A6
MSDDLARRRWLAITLTRIAGTAGAVFGLVLAGRATTQPPQLLGIGIVLSALLMIAIVPRALAHRWRTPPDTRE